jgi:integrase
MMAVVSPRPLKPSTDNVIELVKINGTLVKKPEVRYNKDGSIDKRRPNKEAGKSTEVYPFTSEEEIKAMIDVFDERIKNAPTDTKRWVACRNKMLFLIGINVGLRASDLAPLKWSFFYNEDGTFKEFYTLMPKKTRKAKKFVKIFFNQTVKKAIENYVSDYPIRSLDDYVFKSREGDGYIVEQSLGRIIKDAAKQAGIKQNVCSHSLRKTWAFNIWHNAENQHKALVMLQQCLNHSDTISTMKYIGIMDEEKKEMYESIELGLDLI